MAIQNPEGTKDLLPEEAYFWDYFQKTAFSIFEKYGYLPIETPQFEQTELFVRGIGEATDVVSKEMFSAISGENLKKLLEGGTIKNKSRLSLRPEGTAGVVRAVVQHDLVPQGAAPVKLMYAGPMFRAERPQKGRQRQFNQVGIECLGAENPSVDAEAIIMLMRFYEAIGIPQNTTRLLINSMGCDTCRPAYREILTTFLHQHKDSLCEDCNHRADINPLRVFDCKKPGCREIMASAPKLSDHLCEECLNHYQRVKHYLDGAGITYEEDATLVRGLDYYTRTVFEVQVVEGLGSQNAIGGGGRYDKLAEEIGGRSIPGLGFALGYERCKLALEAANAQVPTLGCLDVFVACVEPSQQPLAFSVVQALRDADLIADMDHQNRSLKSQLKLANKLRAVRVVILGPDELAQGKVVVKDMVEHTEISLSLNPLEELAKQLADAQRALGA